ncbi:sialin isoform X3 [Octopus bimaculoides]|uniref:Major facilitator superfamily (MFS) profile domain-containing protein n=2 Tax=Octopus bimaculoides TaxID=37653 RepID=A0A0L8HSY3_OCTBM|nr:sialin isoform X3 [Octopus bimaculoides]|eukprot:XP_014769647.1 PREDICTED: sialin-like isoform X2 [Octopus bimaculoides]
MSKFTKFVSHYCSCRWRLCYVSFFTLLLMQTLRVDLSMSLVCMLKTPNRTIDEVDLTLDNEHCSRLDNRTSNGENFEGEFEWSNTLQSNMLAGYFYGYIVTNLLGGVLADKYGGKKVMGASIFSASVLTVLHPSLTRISGYFTLVLRILTGLVSGPMCPAIQSLWGRWAPPSENSILIGISLGGQVVGSIVGLSMSGFLCVYGFDNGWGSIFYVFGGLSLVFSFVWIYVVYDNPNVHPTISEEERSYLNRTIKCKSKVKNVPWKSIMTSTAVWAIIMAHTFINWTIFSFQVILPLYMKEALSIDSKSNGLMSSAPFIGQMIAIPFCGRFADFLRSKNYLSTRSIRVLFQSVSYIGSASLIIVIGFLDCNQTTLAGILFFITGMILTFYVGGFIVNHVDIAPKYAGILYGITNTFAALPGFLAPLTTKALTPNGTRQEWQIALSLCAIFSVCGTIIYAIFARGDVQDWAESDEKSIKTSSNEEETINLNEERP